MRLADPVHVRGWRAALDLHYERRGDRTVLARRGHDGPLVVQKPLYPEGGGVCHTIVVHPPGGIAGGDDLVISAGLAPGAHVLLTTPAAGKWYRSIGPQARQTVMLKAQSAAHLEWLPQETIVYDGAHACLETDVQLADDATFIGWDIVCLGRTAFGERYASGTTKIRVRIRRDEQTVWLEQGAIDAGGRVGRAPAGLGGRSVFGSLIASAAGMTRELVNACRLKRAASGATSVTAPPGLLVARYLGDSTEAARNYFEELWACIRAPVNGHAACRPRIWST
jgi:urease accessory protein